MQLFIDFIAILVRVIIILIKGCKPALTIRAFGNFLIQGFFDTGTKLVPINFRSIVTTATPSYIANTDVGLGVISPADETNLGETQFDNLQRSLDTNWRAFSELL